MIDGKNGKKEFCLTLKAEGRQAYASVCSFHHDNAVLKLLDVLDQAQEWKMMNSNDGILVQIADIQTGVEGKAASECSMAQVRIVGGETMNKKEMENLVHTWIKASGHSEIMVID